MMTLLAVLVLLVLAVWLQGWCSANFRFVLRYTGQSAPPKPWRATNSEGEWKTAGFAAAVAESGTHRRGGWNLPIPSPW
ncbi:MAG: hypothetical protein ACLUUJ_03065 [Acutalibacteraceae bacterium]